MSIIDIKENQIDDAVRVLKTITEFDQEYTRELIEKESNEKKLLVIVVYVDGKVAGCVIGFDRFQDNSFYCWLVGVDPVFRGLGLMSVMMKYQENWARLNGFKSLRIKTVNDRREMLQYLIKDGFDISAVLPNKSTQKNVTKKILDRIVNALVKLSGEEECEIKKSRITLQKFL